MKVAPVHGHVPVRVLIADGDPLVCRALARVLGKSADMQVVATSSDQGEVLKLAGQLRPVVTLIDAYMGRLAGLEGLDVVESLCSLLPATRVIVLGVYVTMREEALSAGACRFLLKDCGGDVLVEAIRFAASAE